MDIEWIEKHKDNIDFFSHELPRLLGSPETKGKFFIICHERFMGKFETFEEAMREAMATCPRNEFIIQQAIDESDTVSFLYNQLHGEEPEAG
jgi:hypothetical protein